MACTIDHQQACLAAAEAAMIHVAENGPDIITVMLCELALALIDRVQLRLRFLQATEEAKNANQH